MLLRNAAFFVAVLAAFISSSAVALFLGSPVHVRQTPMLKPSRRHRGNTINSRNASSLAATTRGTRGSIEKRRPRPVLLTHERDFFRQEARLNSMDSYVLVSTLTASMSFGCLVGFSPHIQSIQSSRFFYKSLCLAIQVVSGFSALYGLYATIIFALTILYGKSALGTERDRQYDKFLIKTVRARVRGARCFSLSLALFALEALLVLVERTYPYATGIVTAGCTAIAAVTLYHLYQDWRLLFDSKE